jgi:DNA-binding NarL/FixJ family response regulator
MSPINILIADDHAMVRSGLRRILEGEAGLRVIGEAEDGRSTLAALELQTPDLLMLDLSMPGMDGFELARHLRLCSPPPALVAMTGWGTATDRQRCEAAGFAAHIVKPAQITDIEAVLARVMDDRAQARPADQRAERRRTC